MNSVLKNTTANGALLALLLLITIWTYWGVRSSPFHFDDALFLQSPQVTAPGNAWYMLRPSQSRQLTYLSFYWNYRLCGTRPEGYHVFNLFLHCLNVLGVYILTLLLCRLKGTNSEDPNRWLPIVAAGIFALHPVQTEAVNYIYQRSSLLAAFFSLAALIAFLLSTRSDRPGLFGVQAAVFAILAALCKETALIVPALMLLITWIYSSAAFNRVVQRARTLALVLALVMLSGAGWVLYSLLRKGEQTVGLGLMRQSLVYFVSQAQVLASYLRLMLWPSGLVIDHAFTPAPPLSAYSLLCWLLVIALLSSFIAIRRVAPEVAFWGLSFFILLLPSSTIIPSADMMFEHRLYLPMATASALLAWLLFQICRVAVKQRRSSTAMRLALAAVALTACAVLSRQRTYVWGDNIRLWSDAAAKVPSNARAHYNLGVAYLEVDRQAARGEFERVLALQPRHAQALYNLGWLEQAAGRIDSARRYFEEALRADAGEWQAHQSLANLDILQGRTGEAIVEYEAAIRLKPDNRPAYLSLAALQIQSGNLRGALSTLQTLIVIEPDLLEARYLRAYALTADHRRPEAEEEIRFITSHDRAGTYAQRISDLKKYLDSSPAGGPTRTQ